MKIKNHQQPLCKSSNSETEEKPIILKNLICARDSKFSDNSASDKKI